MLLARVAPFLFLLACASSMVVVEGSPNDPPSDDDESADVLETSDECHVPTDCVLRPQSCCGICGAPTRNDVISIPSENQTAARETACSDGNGICPACARAADPTLIASCRRGTCTALDLTPSTGTAPSLTACETHDDCVIRSIRCCECGSTMNASSVVAIHQNQRRQYEAHICAPDSGCAGCEAAYPNSLRAVCVGEGSTAHCEVHAASTE